MASQVLDRRAELARVPELDQPVLYGQAHNHETVKVIH
jgi:hypothetical protein